MVSLFTLRRFAWGLKEGECEVWDSGVMRTIYCLLCTPISTDEGS